MNTFILNNHIQFSAEMQKKRDKIHLFESCSESKVSSIKIVFKSSQVLFLIFP